MKNPYEKEKKNRVSRLGNFVKNSVGWGAIKSSANDIVKDLNTIKEQNKPQYKESVDFNTAMKNNNASEEEIEKIFSNFRIVFYTNVLLLVFFFLAFIYMAFNNKISPVFIIASIGFVLILLANIFRSSFRCRQISGRKFISVSTWLCNPSYWIPAKKVLSETEFKKQNKKSKVLKF